MDRSQSKLVLLIADANPENVNVLRTMLASDYKIKIECLTDETLFDISDTDFILMDTTLTVENGNPTSLIPIDYTLFQNYPNPFNPVTTIRYDLPEQSQVTLMIYDILGREIRRLINSSQDAGHKSVIWDGTDEFGRNVGTGIYLYRIKAGDFSQTKKMLLLQ